MADEFDLSSIGAFGSSAFIPEAFKVSPGKSQEKQASIEERRMAKALSLASESDLRTVATAQAQGNNLATDSQVIQDMHNLSYTELAEKYGPDVADQRFRYTTQNQAVTELKNAQRSTGQVVGDTALDIGNAAVQTGLGIASLAALPLDWAFGTNGSTQIAEWGQDASEFSLELGSDLRRERNEQHSLEAALTSGDNDAQYQEDLANGDGLMWSMTKRLGRDFAGTVKNYLDDPIMMGSLAPVMIGSMIPSTAAIRAVGMTRAITKVANAQGISRSAAKTFLKTPAGSKLLNAEMLAATTPIIALTEGGAAANQAQVEILSMSEAELQESQEYQTLRLNGLSHEEAQDRLARSAATASTLTAGTLALLTARLGRQFEVNPLKGNGTGILANTSKEVLEEGLQEASGQLGTNIGAETVGLERDLSDGLGSAAAEGALGGLAGAGTLQAPSSIARGSVNVMKRLGTAVVNAAEVRSENQQQALDEASAVGSKAQAQAAGKAVDAASQLTEVSQSTANQGTPSNTIDTALYVPEAETNDLVAAFPALQEVADQNGGRLDRISLISTLGSVVANPNVDEATRVSFSVGVLDNLNQIRGTGSSDTLQAIQEMKDANPEAADAYQSLEDAVNTLESSPAIQAATETVEALTNEQVHEIYDFEALSSSETAPEHREAIVQALTTIGQYNPQALTQADYDMLLEQVGGLGKSERLKASLQTAKLLVEDIQAANDKDAVIEEEQQAFIESLPDEERKASGNTLRKSRKDVSAEILQTQNSSNALPSLVGHRSRFEQAMAAGKLEDAQDHLLELGEFARSMNNKVAAFNASADEGLGKPKPFQAYNGATRYTESEYAPYANVKSSNSIATAKAAHLEASLLTSTFNNLLENNAQSLGELDPILSEGSLETPVLSDAIKFSRAPAKEARIKKSVEAKKKELSDVAEVQTEENTQASDQAPQVTGQEPQTENAETVEADTEENQTTPPQTEANQVEDLNEPALVEDKKPSLKETFAGLVTDANGENKFLQVFKRLTDKSDFLDHEDPATTALEMLKQDPGLSDTQKAAFTDILSRAVPAFKEALEGAATAALKKTRGKRANAWLKDLQNPAKDVLGYNNALSLNFFSEISNKNVEIDPRFIQAAVISSVEWLAEDAGREVPFRKDEDVAKKLGLPRDTVITGDMRSLVQSGSHVQTVLDNITRRMEQILGVQPNKDHSVKYTQGMLRSLAANMVELMLDSQWIEQNEQQAIPGTKRKFVTLAPGTDQYANRVREVLKSRPDVLTKYFVKEPDVVYHIGEAPQKVADHQIRNKLAPLTNKQKEAIRNLQNTPARFNTDFFNMISDFGAENYARLLGFRDIDEKAMNGRDHIRAKGKNASLRSSLEAVNAFAEQMEGLDDTTPIYFEWNISSVGRLQQTGPITPQGNKFAREAITFTNSSIDLQNESELDLLWLAVAQAFDISLEKQSHEKSIQAAKELVGSPDAYRDAVDELKAWQDDGAFSEGAQERLFDAIGSAKDADGEAIEVTDKLLHALLTVARMENAFETGPEALNDFQMHLGIEADGKTDGPIHAIINMGSSHFTPHQVKVMAKGGMFLTDQGTSLNDYIAEDRDDLYHVAAELFEQSLIRSLEAADTEPDSETTQSFLRVVRVMNALVDDFTITDDELSVGRGLVKNPLTVFLYGSGSKGVAGKLLHAAYEKLGKIATESMEQGIPMHRHPEFANNPSLRDDLRYLLNQQVFTHKGKVVVKNNVAGSLQDMMKNPKDFEIKGKAHDNLISAVNQFFAKPMFDAIDQATGGLKANMEFIQNASQVQAQIFAAVYQSMMDEMSQGRTDPLTEREYQEIFQEAQKVAPIYYTDDQAFHIASGQKYGSDTKISASFSDRVSSQATLPFPGEASVKVSPYMVIGTGDGQMILNVYTGDVSNFAESLPVFDGIEMSASTFVNGSTSINESVLEGWENENIFASLAQSFDHMQRNLSGYNVSDIVEADELAGITEQLHSLALESQARKNTLKRMASSVDHMAGADAPHTTDGLSVGETEGYAPELVSQLANEIYTEEVATLRNQTEAKQAKPSTQAADPVLQEMIEAQGQDVPGYALKEFSGKTAVGYMSQKYRLDRAQVKVFWDVLKGTQDIDTYRIFLGSPEELNRLKAEEFAQLNQKPVEQGQTFAGSEVMFISHSSPETLLHELLHAHTAKKLINHYANPEDSFGPEADAVKRLEGLMEQFMALDFESSTFTTGEQIAGQTLQIELLQKTDNPAAQMGEFLSWMLSNQNLMKVAKETKVYSPLQNIGRKALQLLKRLLGIKSYRGDDLFSNVKFNAEVFLRAAPSPFLAQRDAETDALLEQVFGKDPRIADIEQRFMRKLNTILNENADGNPFTDAKMAADVARQRKTAKNAYRRLSANGFHLNIRQQAAFEAVHATLMSSLNLNAAAMRQANRVYGHAIRQMSPDSFLDDPVNATEQERYIAHHKFTTLTKGTGIKGSADGRSDLLATFIALALTDEGLRELLEHTDAPKDLQTVEKSIDGFLSGWTKNLVNTLTHMSITRQDMGRDAQRQLDILAASLSEVRGEVRSKTEDKIFTAADRANEFLAAQLKDGSEKLSDKLGKIADTQQARGNKAKAGFAHVAQFITALGSKDATDGVAESWTEALNRNPNLNTLRSLLNELRGMTPTNKDLYRLINVVKAKVEAVRQDFREGVPDVLAAKFSKKMEQKQWEELHLALGQTDLSVLGRKKALKLLSAPEDVSTLTEALERRIRDLEPTISAKILDKSEALAEYMTSGKIISNNLLRNAEAIAWMFGEPEVAAENPDPQLIEAIDQLVTVYAFGKVDGGIKARLADLMKTEPDGMRTLVGYLHSTRAQEISRVDPGEIGNTSRFNGWKGYVPISTQEGHKMIVADDADFEHLSKLGYTRIGTYAGDRNQKYRGKRGYYSTDVGGKTPFRQGVAQTVHVTWNGVDPVTGQTHSDAVSGLVRGKQVARIKSRIGATQDNLGAGEHLLPIYDSNGQISSYELPVSSDRLDLLKRDKHLGRMLGVWAGRIVEEEQSREFNRELLNSLNKIWEEAKQLGNEDQFVNVADKDLSDPIIRDAWNALGWEMRQDARQIFGQVDFLPIRRDMVENAIGYRSASLVDSWSGITRWSPEVQESIVKSAELFFGKDAYRYIRLANDGIQDLVSYAKTTIVVRSFVVAWENLLSNNVHLLSWGMGPVEIAKRLRDKFIEVSQYSRNIEEIQRLGVELSAEIKDPARGKRLKAQIQALEDANKSLSINPLLEAGEFSTISESLTEADQSIREGKLSEYLEKAVDRLPFEIPDGAKAVAKNVLVTKDTALYKGLNRMIQYGDFIAKAALYDHLKDVKKMPHDEIMDVIAEEFVAYNWLPGRSRDALESMGLTWFYQYKLRIMKVALGAMRTRPLTALATGAGVGPMSDIDTVFSGSLLGNAADGSLEYSLGWGMGLNAHTLNPWVNLAT